MAPTAHQGQVIALWARALQPGRQGRLYKSGERKKSRLWSIVPESGRRFGPFWSARLRERVGIEPSHFGSVDGRPELTQIQPGLVWGGLAVEHELAALPLSHPSDVTGQNSRSPR